MATPLLALRLVGVPALHNSEAVSYFCSRYKPAVLCAAQGEQPRNGCIFRCTARTVEFFYAVALPLFCLPALQAGGLRRQL